jgi:DNA-damage-inducible protein D
MDKSHFNHLFEQLESLKDEVEGVEFWSARDLQVLFGYAKWQNFELAVKKAAISIENTSESLELHFTGVSKSYKMPNGGLKNITDYALTRYACYLIAQNGDPNKEEIAFAQSYFALQTRKQELVEKRLAEVERLKERDKLSISEKLFSKLAFERGVNGKDFGYIRAMGDKAFFGGRNTQQMKDKLAVPKGRPLADYLETPLLTGKELATNITNYNIKNKDLQGTSKIADEHSTNNDEIRQLLIRRGIVPEELPAAEDAKKVKRRLDSEQKKLLKGNKKK